MMTVVYLCSLLALYHYALYPALVIALSKVQPRPIRSRFTTLSDNWPTVTLLIAAYNEERVIANKLKNALSLRYPRPIEIIVIADGSSDRTVDVASTFSPAGVVCLHEAARRGKASALNRGVERARGDVLVFSDANNDFNEFALERLLAPFADPIVGGVCGAKRIRSARDRESSLGDGLYWRYESVIKDAESRIGSITNADGEIFAMRRGLWKPLPQELINDDAQITFDLIDQGYRILYEREAESWELASARIEDDFFVKVRMVAGGFQTLSRHWSHLLPPRTLFAFMFLSHKALRYLMPVNLLLLVIATGSAAILGSTSASVYLAVQAVFVLLAVIGWRMLRHASLPAVLYVPFYFSAMNLAALLGMIRFFRGSQSTNWRKAAR